MTIGTEVLIIVLFSFGNGDKTQKYTEIIPSSVLKSGP